MTEGTNLRSAIDPVGAVVLGVLFPIPYNLARLVALLVGLEGRDWLLRARMQRGRENP